MSYSGTVHNHAMGNIYQTGLTHNAPVHNNVQGNMDKYSCYTSVVYTAASNNANRASPAAPDEQGDAPNRSQQDTHLGKSGKTGSEVGIQPTSDAGTRSQSAENVRTPGIDFHRRYAAGAREDLYMRPSAWSSRVNPDRRAQQRAESIRNRQLALTANPGNQEEDEDEEDNSEEEEDVMIGISEEKNEADAPAL